MPQPGTWAADAPATSLDCTGSGSIPIPPTSRREGTLEVFDGGSRIVGTGLAEGIPIELRADPDVPGRYVGEVSDPGGTGTVVYDWQVLTAQRIEGVLRDEVGVGGATCTGDQGVVLERIGS